MLGPLPLPRRGCDQILAEFDEYMGNAARLAVRRDAEILVVDPVRLVITHHNGVERAEVCKQMMRNRPVLTVEHTNMLGPRLAVIHGRKTVDRNEQRRPFPPCIEQLCDSIMVRLIDFLEPLRTGAFVEIPVAGDRRCFAKLGDQ